MKNLVLLLLVFSSTMATAQIKGKKVKDPITTKSGKVYEKNGQITLAKASEGDTYVYVYKFKSSLSFSNIKKAVNTARNVKNLNVSNVQGAANAIRTAKDVATDKLLASTLQNKVVSEKYRKENAVDSSMEGNTYKIKFFKVYTDEETGEKVIHAIAKGKGGKMAILLDAALEAGEIE